MIVGRQVNGRGPVGAMGGEQLATRGKEAGHDVGSFDLSCPVVKLPAMKRRAFKLVAGLSLLLWLATVCLWLGSQYRQALVSDARAGRLLWLTVDQSGLGIAVVHYWRGHDGWSFGTAANNNGDLDLPVACGERAELDGGEFLGISWYSGEGWGIFSTEQMATVDTTNTDPDVTVGTVGVDWPWPLALTTVFAAPIWFRLVRREMRRRRRMRRGSCLNCGYDLRATPQRCPECGTVPAKSAPPPK